jgi:hypothetical protein
MAARHSSPNDPTTKGIYCGVRCARLKTCNSTVILPSAFGTTFRRAARGVAASKHLPYKLPTVAAACAERRGGRDGEGARGGQSGKFDPAAGAGPVAAAAWSSILTCPTRQVSESGERRRLAFGASRQAAIWSDEGAEPRIHLDWRCKDPGSALLVNLARLRPRLAGYSPMRRTNPKAPRRCSREGPRGDGRVLGLRWWDAVLRRLSIAKHGGSTGLAAIGRLGGGLGLERGTKTVVGPVVGPLGTQKRLKRR